jgi:hypothetical protein
MTDRELLELAAKAASVEYGWQHIYNDYEGSTAEKWDWDPLNDDGDAFRLAVKLGLTGRMSYNGADYLKAGYDPYRAQRIAFVRAAAEIGRKAS